MTFGAGPLSLPDICRIPNAARDVAKPKSRTRWVVTITRHHKNEVERERVLALLPHSWPVATVEVHLRTLAGVFCLNLDEQAEETYVGKGKHRRYSAFPDGSELVMLMAGDFTFRAHRSKLAYTEEHNGRRWLRWQPKRSRRDHAEMFAEVARAEILDLIPIYSRDD